MAPSKKAKAAGVSASSFLDLKAELAKQETEFSKKKAGGAQSYIAGGVQRPDKKPTVWARPNKGVRERNLRDIEAEVASRQTVESVRAALERKAKVYDKLKKGKSGGLSDAQYDALLVDFDAKPADEHYSEDSEDVDESLTVPVPVEDADDPMVEYEDEFGRARTARRSEIPRHLMPSTDTEAQETMDDDPYVIHNPANFFPVFEPSAERVEAIRAAASEEANPLASHYDAARENRAKGAAFYAFSKDEETRAREMEELRRAREATEKMRTEVGAVDVRPGEVEGMVDDGQGGEEAVGEGKEGLRGKEKVLAARSRAMEKRKRELEERKKLIEAKRRKVQGGGGGTQAADEVQAEKVDPFAALESSSTSKASSSTKEKTKSSKWDQKAAPSALAADNFLAQLERDLTKG